MPPNVTKDQPRAVSTFSCSIDQSLDNVPTPACYFGYHRGTDVLPIKQPAPAPLNSSALLLSCLGVLQLCLMASEPIHHCIHTDPNYSF